MKHNIWIGLIIVLGSLSACNTPPTATTQSVQASVDIQDKAAYHVHLADHPAKLSIKVQHKGMGNIRYQWRDYQGKAFAKPITMPSGTAIDLVLPDNKPGYYGLLLQSDSDIALPYRQPGEAREYGFAILPSRTLKERTANPASRFGMVHVDRQDPYMPVWIKTTTWKTYQPDGYWPTAMQERIAVGTLELPLIVGNEWAIDDNSRITSKQLQQLKDRMKAYFQADPTVLYWELGLEENLHKRYKQTFYWPNLAAKVEAVRAVANQVNPKIKLMYQIAERRMKTLETFFQSQAAKSFDIIALHPYAWPDFPSPDKWLVKYLDQCKAIMAANQLSMPIWFSEVGAPHHGNAPGAFFGYPKSGKQVPGQTRAHAPAYMIKLHAIALQQGVEKIFWYNYKDREPGRDYAENHFGLRDHWGFPKPVYPAYYTLHSHLDYKTAAGSQQLKHGIQVHQFQGTSETTWVVWSYPDRAVEIALTDIDSRLQNQSMLKILTMVGTPIKPAGQQIQITHEPLFITLTAP